MMADSPEAAAPSPGRTKARSTRGGAAWPGQRAPCCPVHGAHRIRAGPERRTGREVPARRRSGLRQRAGGGRHGLLRRFMLVIGPVSSAFDLLTFWLLLHVLGAAPAQFRFRLVHRIAPDAGA